MSERRAAPNPDALLALLRRYRLAEVEFRSYVIGVMDGLGIPRDRFAGIDDTTGEILLSEPGPVVTEPSG